MVLCVVLCNLHGLVFLPAFLIILDSCVVSIRRVWRRARSGKNLDTITPTKNGEFKLNGKTIHPSEPEAPHMFLSGSENFRNNLRKQKFSTIKENSTSCDRPEIDQVLYYQFLILFQNSGSIFFKFFKYRLFYYAKV